MQNAVLALDLGTSSCKGALYSAEGVRLALARADYPVHRRAPYFSEQQAEDYVEAARRVCRELAAFACESDVRIAAAGLSTQTPTLIFCDAGGNPLAPAILWQDARAAEEARWLLEHSNEDLRRKWFGVDLPISAAATPAKLLWVQRQAPDVWRATRWVMQPKDYIAWRMTGRFMTDHWCAKGIAHVQSGEVDPEFLALLGKELSPCPPVARPSAVNGNVTDEAAHEWQLPAGIPVSVGWSDALAGILATGAFHEAGGFVLSGTSEIVGCSGSGWQVAKGLYYVPGDLIELRGLELHYGPTEAGGACLTWLAGVFDKTPEDVLALLDRRRTPGPNPILFRPYLNGERTPYWNHELCAGLEGLRSEHDAADLAHAVLQGVSLHERLVLELAEAGSPVRAVALAGGGARDRRWNQLRADVLQRNVNVLRDPETSLRGAAMLAWGALDPAILQAPSSTWFASENLVPNVSFGRFYEEMSRRFRLPL